MLATCWQVANMALLQLITTGACCRAVVLAVLIPLGFYGFMVYSAGGYPCEGLTE
jgi:hypothetical protein